MKISRTLAPCLLATGALALLGGCSGGFGSSSSSSNSLNISGTLDTSAAQSFSMKTLAVQKVYAMSADGGDVFSQGSVDVSDLEVYAEALTDDGTKSETGTVNSDGSFTVSIPGAKGSSVTAVFRDKGSKSEVGVLVFEDASKKDLNGNKAQNSSVVLSDSVALGAISLSSDGKVKVPVAQIADKIGSSSEISSAAAFDPTGTWYMKPFDGTLPNNDYKTVTSDCQHGPCTGMPVTMVRLAGKEFTPDNGKCTVTNGSLSGACLSTDGSAGTADRYALSIWGGNFNDSIGACGSTTGFSEDQARAFGGITGISLPTVAGHNINFGDYVFTSTGFGGDGAPFNEKWMKTGALSLHDNYDCRPLSIGNYRGWACKSKVVTGWPVETPTGATKWNVGVEGGGCFNVVDNKPVNVTNWTAFGPVQCTQQSAAGTYGAGFQSNSCTYNNVNPDGGQNTASISFTCKNIYGTFDDDGSGNPNLSAPASLAQNEHLGQPEKLASLGDACSSIGAATPAKKLAAYRCYAENYWSNQASAGSCAREYRFNWAATTAADFVQPDYRGKPKNAFVTNILNYARDGQSGTLEDEQMETITISTGVSSSTFCQVARRTNLTFKKVSSSRLLVDLKETGRMASSSAACQGAAKDVATKLKNNESIGNDGSMNSIAESLRTEKTLFYMDSNL